MVEAKTRRGVHTRRGVPHEADIEVDLGLEQVFKVQTYVCRACDEYCTDKTVQFLSESPDEKESSAEGS